MSMVWAVLLLLVLLVGWAVALVGMPGNWLNVGATAIYAQLVPAESSLSIGWRVVAVAVVLAILGELVELAAASLGTARAGGSRRGAVLALAGSMVGAVVGVVVGLPIPLVGPVAAALVFGGLGALAGAMIGEQWKGRTLGESWEVGKAAFWGRLLGTTGKVMIGSVIVVVVAVALVV